MTCWFVGRHLQPPLPCTVSAAAAGDHDCSVVDIDFAGGVSLRAPGDGQVGALYAELLPASATVDRAPEPPLAVSRSMEDVPVRLVCVAAGIITTVAD